MSLRGSCTICTDYFDAENDISVTPCGHLFHALCLNQWIETCKAKCTCPQCRRLIASRGIVSKIFINIPEENEEAIDPYVLKNKVDELEGLLKKCAHEKSDLQSTLRAMEDSHEKMMNKIKQLKSDKIKDQNVIQLLKSDIDTLKTETSHFKAIKDEMKQLKLRLRTLEKVEICINGQKSDVDDMLAQYSNASSSWEAKQLATFCVAMKQEYDTLKESRSKLNSQVMKMKKDLHKANELLISKISIAEGLEKANANLLQSEEALTEENQSLKKKIKSLQLAIASPTDTRTSALNRLISESPAPECLTPINGLPKRKLGSLQTKSKNFSIKKPCLSSSSEIDLNDSCDTENNRAIPFCIPDTPDQKGHKKETPIQTENLMITSISSNKKTDASSNFNYANPLSIRNRLLSGKVSANRPTSYDGLGGHKKVTLQKSTIVLSKKFSSSHTSTFRAAKGIVMSNPNRFERLKRIHPK